MRKHFFWLHYPDPATGERREERIELAVEGAPLPETALDHYLKERGLNKIRKRLHIKRMRDSVPLHWWYVPQSGDVVHCSVYSGDPGT